MLFARHILRRPMRPYQVEPARAIAHAALTRDGRHYVIRWPRQSGKDETIAQVIIYLLFRLQRQPATIVYVAPTYEPQALQSIERIIEICGLNPIVPIHRADYELSIGTARAVFLSGRERTPPNVGPSANTLLIANEAQDLDPDYFSRAFAPMTASTNAPTLFAGTARHDRTLLAAERKAAELAQAQDSHRRVWVYSWRDIAAHVPAYGAHVRAAIERMGEHHPTVQTEYENIETAQTGRLFDSRRINLIFAGQHRRVTSDTATSQPTTAGYVATVDVGGADLAAPRDSAGRAHDLTVVAVHAIHPLADGTVRYVTSDYLTLRDANVLDDTPDRARLVSYLAAWPLRRIVVDATGLGAGLASHLIARFGNLVSPFVFSPASKTRLLSDWLSLIETGRYQHYTAADNWDEDQARLQTQLEQCEFTQAGAHTEWGVPEHRAWWNAGRQQHELLHDDHLIACALVAATGELSPAYFPATIIERPGRRRRYDDK